MDTWQPVYSTPGGWLTVERLHQGDGRSHYAVRSGSACPGAVALATRADDVLLVRSHRVAVDQHMWELPRGFGAPDDAMSTDDPTSYVATARRELQEETGLTGGRATCLGTVHPDSGILTEAVGVVWISEPAGTPGALDEIESAAWHSWDDLDQQVAAGHITDGFTLAAMTLFRAVHKAVD